eukprot:GHUV01012997.1.p1 GENE.GHUV01012997.1~~GHUV01012997.1.p1  ORF type:complete len:217 (+),score=101.72 GHUV01012997.1:367-1017(+)
MLAYAELAAQPEWQLLGKKLGKDMGKVAAAVKALSVDDILGYEKSGSITVAGYELGPGEIKVVRNFKPPAGVAPGDVDAAGDGEVLVVMDLVQQEDLVAQGLAREVVNRYQRLRKKAGLTVTDVVDLYFAPAAAADGQAAAVGELISKIMSAQSAYLKESLGVSVLELSTKPEDRVVIAEEVQSVGGEEFMAVIAAAPGSSAVTAAAKAVQNMSVN